MTTMSNTPRTDAIPISGDRWADLERMTKHAEDLERQLANSVSKAEVALIVSEEDGIWSGFSSLWERLSELGITPDMKEDSQLEESHKDSKRLEWLIKNEYQVVERGMRYVIWDAHVDPSRCTDEDRKNALIAEDYMARDAIDKAMKEDSQ